MSHTVYHPVTFMQAEDLMFLVSTDVPHLKLHIDTKAQTISNETDLIDVSIDEIPHMKGFTIVPISPEFFTLGPKDLLRPRWFRKKLKPRTGCGMRGMVLRWDEGLARFLIQVTDDGEQMLSQSEPELEPYVGAAVGNTVQLLKRHILDECDVCFKDFNATEEQRQALYQNMDDDRRGKMRCQFCGEVLWEPTDGDSIPPQPAEVKEMSDEHMLVCAMEPPE